MATSACVIEFPTSSLFGRHQNSNSSMKRRVLDEKKGISRHLNPAMTSVNSMVNSDSNSYGTVPSQENSGHNTLSSDNHHQRHPPKPSTYVTTTNAAFYVLSGCGQPLLMTLLKGAGLADPNCQLYMLFYYSGPASVIIPLIFDKTVIWPSRKVILQACSIAIWDIMSTSMNYTGASLAGPTIFAIVYSSVTVWTALFSQLFFGRRMNFYQWLGVVTVFGGLTLTASDSTQLGPSVWRGLLFVLFGSAMHALTYVMSEAVMTKVTEPLSVSQNCAVQGIVACFAFFLWQLIYTLPRYEEKILEPMLHAETSGLHAMEILLSFAGMNLIHAITFFHTLRHYPGGATSAGVMKGLQAVLVFCFTDWLYCGRIGGDEMCFTRSKFVSLVTVCAGLIIYGSATQHRDEDILAHGSHSGRRKDGYEPVEEI